MIAAPTFRTIYKKKQRNVLDLFSVEGEGGYQQQNYTFMFKSSAFFNNNILPAVQNIIASSRTIKSFTLSGQTFNYLDNVLRVSLGNHNVCVMYRDGTIDIGKKTYNFPYLASIMYDIRDTFTPSSYSTGGAQYQQMLLLDNGDLVAINTYTQKNTTLLTDVKQFLTKNQAHRSDAIVGMKNGDMYHVWVGPTPTGSNDGNGTATGVQKINGLNHNDLLFCTIGDPPAAATFCKKSDPQNIYRFIKGYSTNFKITGFNTTPIASMALTDPTEYYVDGMSQEFNSLFLTNKKFIHKSTGDGGGNYSYTANDWGYGWTRGFTSESPAIFAKKIATPTAYSMIIEDSFGKYWLCQNNNYVLSKPIRYVFFDTLKTYLEPIRAKIN
jgi:hypothetical protein